MAKTKFFRLMGNADKTNCYAKKDYGIKHAFFVDPSKVNCGLRSGLLANGFIVYFIRYSNNTWDAIEERTGLSCRPPQVDVRVATYEEIFNAVAQYKEYIFEHLVYGEANNEFVKNSMDLIAKAQANENK